MTDFDYEQCLDKNGKFNTMRARKYLLSMGIDWSIDDTIIPFVKENKALPVKEEPETDAEEGGKEDVIAEVMEASEDAAEELEDTEEEPVAEPVASLTAETEIPKPIPTPIERSEVVPVEEELPKEEPKEELEDEFAEAKAIVRFRAVCNYGSQQCQYCNSIVRRVVDSIKRTGETIEAESIEALVFPCLKNPWKVAEISTCRRFKRK